MTRCLGADAFSSTVEPPMPAPVVIVDYDPTWPDSFTALADRVAASLGPLAVRVEHVGSTAVPGLPAKPIIDLIAVIPTRDDLPAAVERLATIGYVHRGDLGIAGREAFDPPPGNPAHHPYVCATANPELAKMVAFRDYLRSHPAAAGEYGAVKRLLAAEFGTDRDGYTEAKTAFITGVLARVAS